MKFLLKFSESRTMSGNVTLKDQRQKQRPQINIVLENRWRESTKFGDPIDY
jgi:hypothetical protein